MFRQNLVVMAIIMSMTLSSVILSAQVGGTGIPILTQVDFSFIKQTELGYALPDGMSVSDLSLIDQTYMRPKNETWRITIGKTNAGTPYSIHQNLSVQPTEATFGYKIGYIVMSDTATDVYDYRNVLIRHTIWDKQYIDETEGTDKENNEKLEDDEWLQVIALGKGITKYVAEDFFMVENLNNGTVAYTFPQSNGREMNIFEYRDVVNGELGRLNYRLKAIPYTSPSGLCISELISEKYSGYYTGEEPKREKAQDSPIASLSISPNPVINQLNVNLSNYTGSLPYKIFNLSGEVTKSGQLYGNNVSIDVVRLPPGVYILSVQTGNGNINERFIKL